MSCTTSTAPSIGYDGTRRFIPNEITVSKNDWVEGPSAIKIGDHYLVYFDHYAQPQYYGAARSKDLRQWEDCSKEMSFPKGHRHGTVLRVPQNIAQGLNSPHD